MVQHAAGQGHKQRRPKFPNEKITKMDRANNNIQEKDICSIPPNSHRPKPCQTTGKSTQRNIKHKKDPQPDSVTTMAEKKKLQKLKEKSWAEAKNLKKMKQANKQARPHTCNFYRKEGHFFWDCPEVEKLRKLSTNSLGNA